MQNSHCSDQEMASVTQRHSENEAKTVAEKQSEEIKVSADVPDTDLGTEDDNPSEDEDEDGDQKMSDADPIPVAQNGGGTEKSESDFIVLDD